MNEVEQITKNELTRIVECEEWNTIYTLYDGGDINPQASFDALDAMRVQIEIAMAAIKDNLNV